MLDTVTEYLRALDAREIRTHKDALNFFSVRYSSFGQNYPKKCLIPGCLLAQHGFHFDANTNAIMCVECTFAHDRLDDEDLTLSSILARHLQFNNTCRQAQHSLESTLNEIYADENNEGHAYSTVPPHLSQTIDNAEENCDQIDEDLIELRITEEENSSEETTFKAKFVTIESRLKTFESAKMLIDRNKLAETGLFLVLKDASVNQSLGIISNASNTRQTQIEKVAQSIPFLHHVKCAFCAYECLLFRNSLLNTYYKSPFDEHREKYGAKCPMFVDSYEENESQSDPTYPDWVKLLYDFETGVTSNGDSFYGIDETTILDKSIEVKTMPQIIEHLVAYNMNMNQSTTKRINQSTSGTNNPNLVYMPKASSNFSNTNDITTTSDFNQLQTVLNQTHNVMSGKAYTPSFTQLQARLDTFRDWPATLSQQPADLAKAGFYYFGIKDMVKCFYCNGGLKNWDHNDDPYEDHVRWFPKCQYIRQLMGVEYIEKVREKFKNEESGFNTGEQDNLAGSSNQTNTTDLAYREGSLGRTSKSNMTNGVMKKRSTSPRSLNSRLDTHIIRKILDSNILTRDSIKQAFDIKLSTGFDVCGTGTSSSVGTGAGGNYADDFKSPVELAMFAYDLDKAKSTKQAIIGSISDLIICGLPARLTTSNVREFVRIKYGVDPAHVRILKCINNDIFKSYCLITLKPQEKSLVDEIVKDTDKGVIKKYLRKEEGSGLLAFKTNWAEIEEKIKPLLGKDTSGLPTFQSLTTHHPPAPKSAQSRKDAEKKSVVATGDTDALADALKSIDQSKEQPTKQDTALLEEYERLKNERLCVICLSKEKNVIFLPCAHFTACLECSMSLNSCPMCRSDIQARIRAFS